MRVADLALKAKVGRAAPLGADAGGVLEANKQAAPLVAAFCRPNEVKARVVFGKVYAPAAAAWEDAFDDALKIP